MTQDTLFGPRLGQHHAHAGDTEKQAAQYVYLRSGTQRRKVLEALAEGGPATDHDLSLRLTLPLSSICGRRNELLKDHLIRACGTIPGPYGPPNQLWKITAKGRDVL